MFTQTACSSSQVAPCYKWLKAAPKSVVVAEYPNGYKDNALYALHVLLSLAQHRQWLEQLRSHNVLSKYYRQFGRPTLPFGNG